MKIKPNKEPTKKINYQLFEITDGCLFWKLHVPHSVAHYGELGSESGNFKCFSVWCLKSQGYWTVSLHSPGYMWRVSHFLVKLIKIQPQCKINVCFVSLVNGGIVNISGYKCLLLLHKIQTWLLTPTSGFSQRPVTQVAGDPGPSAGLHTHMCIHIDSHIHNKK